MIYDYWTKCLTIGTTLDKVSDSLYCFRGATIERKLREDPNNTALLGQFLELVNVKNELMR